MLNGLFGLRNGHCFVVFAFLSTIAFGNLHVVTPEYHVGPLMLSVEDAETDSTLDKRHLMVVFDYQCLENQAGFDETIHNVQQSKTEHLMSVYPCLNHLLGKHFPHARGGHSVTYFSIDDISEDLSDYHDSCIFDDSVSLNYDDMCIDMFLHEPLSKLSVFDGSFQRLTSDEYECECDNTHWTSMPAPFFIDGWHLDQLDETILNNKYCYPDMSNFDNGVDLFILDTGIRGTHDEFNAGQVIESGTFTPAITGNPTINHGTHVAGSAGGLNYGSSRHVRTIYDYRVFQDDGFARLDKIEEALSDIRDILGGNNRRGVINLSLGGIRTTAKEEVYDEYFPDITDNGGIVVVAAGNDDLDANDFAPAYSSDAITVGSTGENYIKSSWSNWGDVVDIWGPGGENETTPIQWVISSVATGDSDYDGSMGTSMAAPHVAGVIANMLFVDPSLTFDQVKMQLNENTVTVTGDECDDSSYDCQFSLYRCGECDLPGLVTCENDPCDCYDFSADPHCSICHPNGCDQCESGFWKQDYDSPCLDCQETFGDGCLHCQDFNGCGQCADGYQRVLNHECGVYECEEDGAFLLLSCNNDIIFALDESGSITDLTPLPYPGYFPLETGFAIDVINILDDGANIGVLTFDGISRPVWQLDDEQEDRNAVKQAINDIEPNGGGTNFIPAIEDALTMFNSGDPANPNVMILVTDGNNGDACDLRPDLDAAGVTMIVVGIGDGFNPEREQTVCLVNDPDIHIMHSLTWDADDLNAILFDLARRACGGPCPVECNNEPCRCSELAHCNICHNGNGCDLCDSGYFKVDYDHICEDCQLITGEGCLFCQDFNGCGQCASGYNRVWDSDCNLYVCE